MPTNNHVRVAWLARLRAVSDELDLRIIDEMTNDGVVRVTIGELERLAERLRR